ncbi:unnamed protein product [Phytophthora lilii]|uniref:Unnamed protein product n=1 Tax=Phytophthora lilii TaxID=2077276 RepID=A0A9W6WRQ1_9STRA|nr:unnamed protein product [Phytophthora lilii]
MAKDRGNSSKTQRRIHRPDTTLQFLENTWDMIAGASAGDMHDQTLRSCQQHNGEPVLIRAIGVPDKIVVSSPEGYEDVLKNQFDNFPKGSFHNDNIRDLLGNGIFPVDGKE